LAGFEHRHPTEADAYISLKPSSSTVQISCNWPLDREHDEWFRFKIEVSRDDFQACVHDLEKTGTGTLIASPDKRCSFLARPSSFIAIEMSTGDGALRKTLYLDRVSKIANLIV
jgi:hypothetical protein